MSRLADRAIIYAKALAREQKAEADLASMTAKIAANRTTLILTRMYDMTPDLEHALIEPLGRELREAQLAVADALDNLNAAAREAREC